MHILKYLYRYQGPKALRVCVCDASIDNILLMINITTNVCNYASHKTTLFKTLPIVSVSQQSAKKTHLNVPKNIPFP